MAERAYGVDALDEAIARVDFPISKKELVDQLGDEMVEVVKGYPIRLWMLLANCPDKVFHSRDEFLTCDAVQEALRTEDEAV